MPPKVVYVTSQFPFGNSEMWTAEEVLALRAAGVDVVIVPRTSSGGLRHGYAQALLPYTLRAPFMSLGVLRAVLALALRRPGTLASLVFWICKQANTPLDVAKGLFVLPKATWLARRLAGQNVRHIHAFSTTTVAVVAYVLSEL